MDVITYESRFAADARQLAECYARPAMGARLGALFSDGADPGARLRRCLADAQLLGRVQEQAPGEVLLSEELRWPQALRGQAKHRAALLGYFRGRHRLLAGDAARWRREDSPGSIAVSGASGMVGSALVQRLRAEGHAVLRLVRQAAKAADEIAWDPSGGVADPSALSGIAAVIHLAGANVAGGRWTRRRKALIRKSRVAATRALAETIAGLERPPRLFLAASATGYYGEGGESWLPESADPGRDWLAGVAQDWESACGPAREAGIRVVNLRIGMILSGQGGALARLLPLYRLGLGGLLGKGRQYMSWISLDELLDIVCMALSRDDLAGPINAVSPGALRNRDFSRQFASLLGRPDFLPAPAPALRLLLGEMAQALLLTSSRVEPARLAALGFPFRHAQLEPALRDQLLLWDRALPGERWNG